MAILLPPSSSAGITCACLQDEQKLVLEPDAGNTRSSHSKHDPHADPALHCLPSDFIPFTFVPCVCGLHTCEIYTCMCGRSRPCGAYTCVCVAYNRVCVCDVEPQADIRCFLSLLGQGLSLSLELTNSAGLVGQQPQGHLCPRLLSPGSQVSAILHILHGVSAQVLMLRHQALSSHGHLPQPFVGIL